MGHIKDDNLTHRANSVTIGLTKAERRLRGGFATVVQAAEAREVWLGARRSLRSGDLQTTRAVADGLAARPDQIWRAVRARMLVALGDFSAGRAFAQHASEQASAHSAVVSGYIALAEWRLLEAHADLERAVAFDPDDTVAWQWLGRAYERMEKRAEASESYARAAETENESTDANNLRALAAAMQRWPDDRPSANVAKSDVLPFSRLRLAGKWGVPRYRWTQFPLLRCRVNGGPSALFMLDTGARSTLIDTHYAGEVGLTTLADAIQRPTAGDRFVTTRYALARELEFEDAAIIRNLIVEAGQLPFAGIFRRAFGERIGGILGWPILRYLDIQLDAEAITFAEPGSLLSATDEATHPMCATTHLVTDVTVNERHPMLAIVDSGWLESLALSREQVAQLELGTRQRWLPPVSLGVGGIIRMPPTVSVASLKVGNQVLPDPGAELMPITLPFGDDPRPHAIVGRGFLNRYRCALSLHPPRLLLTATAS